MAVKLKVKGTYFLFLSISQWMFYAKGNFLRALVSMLHGISEKNFNQIANLSSEQAKGISIIKSSVKKMFR